MGEVVPARTSPTLHPPSPKFWLLSCLCGADWELFRFWIKLDLIWFDFEHITQVLENLHWLPVQQRIMFKVVLFVFKCLNGLAPPYLAELITVKENSCSCQLRSDGCLQEKKTNNKFGDRAFSICGPVLWNRLPKCMKEINSLDKFKKELKTHLFKEAFG